MPGVPSQGGAESRAWHGLTRTVELPSPKILIPFHPQLPPDPVHPHTHREEQIPWEINPKPSCAYHEVLRSARAG